MAPKKSLLDKMKANNADNWTIKDIEKVCKDSGLHLESPTTGSHYKAYSDHLGETLTIPAKRPIKAIYIRMLTNYIENHCKIAKQKGDKK